MDSRHTSSAGHSTASDARSDEVMDLDTWMSQNPSFRDPDMPSFFNDVTFDKSRHNTGHIDRLPTQPAPYTTTSQQATNVPQPHLPAHSSVRRDLDIGSSNDPSDPWDNIFSHHALDNFSKFDKTLAKRPLDDEDAASCNSECERSCPSECGETGQGQPCVEDHCAATIPCHDEQCSAVSDPCPGDGCDEALCDGDECFEDVCHSSSCVNDGALGPNRTGKALLSDGDKAAAEALASFVGEQAPLNSFSAPSMHGMAPDNGFNPRASYNLGGSMDLTNYPMDFSMHMSPADINSSWLFNAQYQLATHLLHHHNPSFVEPDHQVCQTEHANQLFTTCSLPRQPYNVNDGPFEALSSTELCGFHPESQTDFTNHVFQEHKKFIMNNPTQPHFGSMSFANQLQDPLRPALPMDFNFGLIPPGTNSTPPSPCTNTSIGNTTRATPATPPTPSSSDVDQILPQHSALFFKIEHDGSMPTAVADSSNVTIVCRWMNEDGSAFCGQTFGNEELLHVHCKEHHLRDVQKGPDGFGCSWDSCYQVKSFPQRSKLERHLLTHTLYKPMQCPICKKFFSAQQALTQHIRTHTGDEPWACTYPGCGKTFKQQSALTMHVRSHTGLKPLKCEVCGKMFSESSNLSKHRRIHNQKGQHVCGICHRDFHRLDQLRRHLKSKHKDQPDRTSHLLQIAEQGGRGRVGGHHGRASSTSEPSLS